MFKTTTALALVALLFISQSSSAAPIVVLPAKTFKATLSGASYSQSFSHSQNGAQGVITVTNGDGSDLRPKNCAGLSSLPKILCKAENLVRAAAVVLFRASSIEVTVNNQVLVTSTQLPPAVGSYQRSLMVNASNAIKVKIKGSPLAFIKIEIKAESSSFNQSPLANFTATPSTGIAPILISFSGLTSSDPDGTIASYAWEFGDGGVSIDAIPTHLYNAPGTFAVKLTVRDNQGASNSKTQSVIITQDTTAPVLTILSPAANAVIQGNTVQISGDANERLSSATAELNGETAVALSLTNGSLSFSGNISSTIVGTRTLTIKGRDIAGNQSIKTVSFVFQASSPPLANLQIKSPANGEAPHMVLFDSSLSTDPNGQPLNIEWEFGDGGVSNQKGIVTHLYQQPGSYTVKLKVTNTGGLSDTKTAAVNTTQVVLPPNPQDIAPAISPIIPISFNDQMSFIYEGANPIQKDVYPNAIDKERVSILRGQVLNENQSPISGVKVTVLDGISLGYTLSRADGFYDIAVNGGSIITLTFEKTGYLPIQRSIDVKYKDQYTSENIILIPTDPKVTQVALATDQTQIVQGSTITDQSGSRTATLILPKSVAAQIELPNGGTLSMPTLSMRITEWTKGENGPQKMPATLPANSGYTYAVDVTADEALALKAKHIKFSKPVALYVDNFLGFATGTLVPVGAYDYDKGLWLPKENGKVIGILALQSGRAVLDVTGAGQPATTTELATLGIDDDELVKLASTYPAGKTLWRARLDRFSPIDLNWFAGADAAPPGIDELPGPLTPNDCPMCKSGSIIDVSSQSLSEVLPLIGTDLSLVYSTQRMRVESQIPIILSGPTIDANVQRIDLVIDVAGRRFERSFPAAPNLDYNFVWDLKDAYGRNLVDQTKMKVKITFQYSQTYFENFFSANPSFGSFPSNIRDTLIAARDFGQMSTEYEVLIGPGRSSNSQFGGWSLSNHHQYDPENKIIYFGNGSKLVTSSVTGKNDLVVTAFAGTGTQGVGDVNVPATQARLSFPISPYYASDKSVYIYESGSHRIRRVRPDGIIENFAGNGVAGYSGDGGPAIDASIANAGVMTMTEGVNKDIYVADWGNYVIRKIDRNGIITTVAGTPTVGGYSGDGGPALSARFANIEAIAYRDGYIYVADSANFRIREITPEGTVRTIVGNGITGISPDGTVAVAAQIGYVPAIAFSNNGELYFTNSTYNVIQKVNRQGQIEKVAGTGTRGFSGDGGPALSAQLNLPTWLEIKKDNTIIVNDKSNLRLRQISSDGTIRTIAGSNSSTPAKAYELSLNTGLADARYFDISPEGDIYIAETGSHRILKLSAGFTAEKATDGAYQISSSDGSEFFIFDKLGTHLRTLNSMTGAIKWQFIYSNNLLTEVRDGFGNVTTLSRNAQNNVQQITAPFDQVMTLQYNSQDFLSGLTKPNGDAFAMNYLTNGLMSDFKKPNTAVSTFEYYANGTLKKDTDILGGFTELLRTFAASARSFTTFSTSAEGRQDSITVQSANGWQSIRHQYADGLSLINQNNSHMNVQTKNTGVTVTTTNTLDTRLRGPATYIRSQLTTQGTTYNFSKNRTYVNLNYNDIFNFEMNDATFYDGSATVVNYKSSNRTYTKTTPRGKTSQVQTNIFSQPIYSKTGGLTPVQTQYDLRGRPISITQGNRVTLLTYGANGKLATILDPENRVTNFEYDQNLRMSKVIAADGGESIYQYDANDNLVGVTPAGRAQHNLSHNLVDLLTSYLPPGLGGTSTPTSYQYNLDKQLTKITKPDGQEVTMFYDNLKGHLIQTQTQTGNYNYSYSSNGQMASVTSPDAISTQFTYTGDLTSRVLTSGAVNSDLAITYDNLFLPRTIKVNSSTITVQHDADQFLYQAGDIFFTFTPEGLINSTTLAGMADRYVYNTFGELERMYTTAPAPDNLPYQAFFERDKLGRIISKVSLENYHYEYDFGGRLSLARRYSELEGNSYSYDQNGNRTHAVIQGQTYIGTYDQQDRLLTYGTKAYSYTLNGELSQVTDSSNGQSLSFQYDSFGTLKKVFLPQKNIEYILDGQNRRVGKKVNGVLTQGFVYQSQLQIAGEMDASGALVSHFVYGPKSHVPEYMIRDGIKYKIISDQVGSVNLVVNSANGAVVQRMNYDEFGQVLLDTNPGFQPFGFAGGLYDRDTKLVRFGARDYNPEVGRWTSKDPIRFNGGDSNLYVYAGNDPINNIDSSGLTTTIRIYSNNLGHVSVQVGSGPAQGFYPKDANSAGDYLSSPGTLKNDSNRTDILDTIKIDTTPQQEALIREYYAQHGSTENYGIFGNNCAAFAGNALSAAGVRSTPENFPALFGIKLRMQNGL